MHRRRGLHWRHAAGEATVGSIILTGIRLMVFGPAGGGIPGALLCGRIKGTKV